MDETNLKIKEAIQLINERSFIRAKKLLQEVEKDIETLEDKIKKLQDENIN